MAEPLGLIGVVGVAVQLIQLSTQLGLDWKDAPAEARSFILELQSLKTVLSETNTNTLLNQDFADAFHGRHSALLSEFDPLHATSTLALVSACQQELESLLADLSKRAQGHRLGWERLKAAFAASRMREAVENLQRRCSALNELLQVDVAAIAASTHREVREGRREQQQQHQAQARALGHIRERVDNQEDRQEEERVRRERETILDKLDSADYSLDHHDLLRRRQPGTGQWLLESDQFKTWIAGDNQMLFCPGIPGAGKTILSATVIDHLHAQFHGNCDVGIAYLYCNFRRSSTQKAEALVRNLLKQLVLTRPSLPGIVKAISADRGRSELDTLLAALKSVVSGYFKVYVVVDALDECSPDESCRENFLAQLFDLQYTAGVNLFATSRPIPDIVDKFRGFVSLEILARGEDVGLYLQGHMGELMPFVAGRKDLREKIVTSISNAVDGMFLLAILLFQSLRDKATPKAVKKALDQLQKQSTTVGEDQKLQVLNRTYDEAMERIDGQMPGLRDLAKRVLSWITCARAPLKVLDLQHALAVELDEEELDEENLPDPGVMVSVCAGLVTVDDESRIIRLVHYTTQEYFEQTQARWFPDAQLDMARTCTKYLAYEVFAGDPCQTLQEFTDQLSHIPLYMYAAEYWAHHARNADTDCEEVVTLLQLDAHIDSLFGRPYLRYEKSTKVRPRVPQEKFGGLHWAAKFGLQRALQRLLTLPGSTNPDIRGPGDWTPLALAAENGHEGVVKLLLATNNVDVNAAKYAGATPVHHAAEKGYEGVLQALLAVATVDVNARSFCGGSPLNLAAKAGHEGTVRMLLARSDVDVNLRDDVERTALTYAAEEGHERVVRMLLDTNKVNVNIGNNAGCTPLIYAADSGHERVVRMLLDASEIDVNLGDRQGRTPLIYAAEEGQERVVRMLLDVDEINVDLGDKLGRTPLSFAAQAGHQRVVRMLLATGRADVNAEDRDHWTPHRYAVASGDTAMAHLLRDYGAKDTGDDGFRFKNLHLRHSKTPFKR